MMVITAKVNKRSILIAIAAVAAILLILFWPSGKNSTDAPAEKADTNEQRIAYLESFGWKVKETPVETREVRVPQETNPVFDRYNKLQLTQGFDLTEHAGKIVRRYVYEILNYPDTDGSYRATIYVLKDRVVGGDVAATHVGGKMHGLAMPDINSLSQ